MTNKAILYARVSTSDQADKGYSIPSQFDAERQYAAREGFEVVAEFQDDYSGATPIEHRPEGSKAYAMLKSGAADAIIAYTIDRFVRPPEDGDEWEMPILIRGLARLGKEIHTCDIGKLKTDFVSLLLVVIGAKSAGEERRKIRERSMRGKREKAKAGRVVGGRAPYGYRHVRDSHGLVITFRIEPAEARIVQQIYQWYVHGDEAGKRLSARAIALRLTELRIPTPADGLGGSDHPRGPSTWGWVRILDILGNERYAGVWWFGVHIGLGRETRPREEQIAVDIPPIVERDLWQAAQARRENQRSRRYPRYAYLLRGLIHCGCRYSMSGDSAYNHRRYFYYSCGRWKNHPGKPDASVCRAKMVRADAIEADVWNEIAELFSHLDPLGEDLQRAQKNGADRLDPILEKLALTDGLIREAEGQADQIARALCQANTREALFGSLKVDEQATRERLDALLQQRWKLVTELGKRNLTDSEIQMLVQFASDVRTGIDGADYGTRRQMLELLGVSVTVAQERYRITCLIAEKEGAVRKIPKRDAAGKFVTQIL